MLYQNNMIFKWKKKGISYSLEAVNNKVVHFVCKEAWMSEEFLKEDISNLIDDLPNIIEKLWEN